MLVLVIVLVVTNLAALAGLAYLLLRPPAQPRPDRLVVNVLDGAPPPHQSSSATRRVISVEILNPVQLARTRGRLAGFAGSIAPGLVKRIVYDQTIKTLRRQLAEEGVVADVRMYTLRPPERTGAQRTGAQRPPVARPAPTGAAQVVSPAVDTPDGAAPDRPPGDPPPPAG